MGLSLGAAVLMVVGKVTAYLITGSAAIFADAAEALVHGVATGGAAFALWYADRPRDADHPYGHGKIVYFSAGFEGALIFVAGGGAIAIAIRGLLGHSELHKLGWGVAITGSLAALNLALGFVLIRVGRRQSSLVLEANGKHVLADVWIGGGAVVGVCLTWITGIRFFDPAAGLVVGVAILFSAFGLLREAYRGLMERAEPALGSALAEALDAAQREGRIAGHHALRFRRVNDRAYIDVHLLLDGALSVAEGHRVATAVEGALRGVRPELADACITTHLEPAEEGHRPEAQGAAHHDRGADD